MAIGSILSQMTRTTLAVATATVAMTAYANEASWTLHPAILSDGVRDVTRYRRSSIEERIGGLATPLMTTTLGSVGPTFDANFVSLAGITIPAMSLFPAESCAVTVDLSQAKDIEAAEPWHVARRAVDVARELAELLELELFRVHPEAFSTGRTCKILWKGGAAWAKELPSAVPVRTAPRVTPSRDERKTWDALAGVIGFVDREKAAQTGRLPLFVPGETYLDMQGRVAQPLRLRWAEYDYEVGGILVYGVVNGHYKVVHDEQVGWISAESLGTLLPLEKLLPEKLAYVSLAWSGKLYGAPGGKEIKLRFKSKAEQPVRVLKTETTDGKVWALIALLSAACGEGPEKVVQEGWVPLVGEGGVPSVWFHSRGC